MAFRDDVVLTLVLVAALASGSSAATGAAVSYRGGYDPTPSPTDEVRSGCPEIAELIPQPRISALAVRHDAERITVSFVVSGLARAQLVDATVPVLTPSGRWDLGTGPWGHRVVITRPTPPPELPEGGCVMTGDTAILSPCPRSSVAIDRPAERITFSLPRRCLREPDWVRAGALVTIREGGAYGFAGYDPAGSGTADWFAPVLGPRVIRDAPAS